MKVKDHYLFSDDDQQVSFDESPNQSGLIKPMYLIMHYTADVSFHNVVSWFENPEAKASAHLVIGTDGSLVQMVRFNKKAWHAGISQWGELESMNSYSIGIELVNAGKLNKRADGKWINWANSVIPDEQVVVLKHKDEDQVAGWQIYSQKQIDTAVEVALALHGKYSFEDILGHDDVAPGRKVDPGPAFPMISFKSRVLGRE
ncbi:MAG: N-acetylmuramoyl-L-alanine amidase [Desulfobaccales bacterium]